MTRIRHSVCRWCHDGVPLEELCIAVKELGIKSIELLMPMDFAMLKKHGLSCAMVSFPTGKTPTGITVGTIEKAFNRLEHHDTLVEIYEPHLIASAAAGAKNIICFSGNREGLSDDEGLENCAIGIRRILPLAEKWGVSLVMELLNSKIDHPDYQCDHTAWGVELCKRIGSKNFGLLYDIYHMQIMEGDIIRTIRENHEFISHYHTGGCPGRNEIDGTQEIFYPAIMRAIAATGYQGFVGQEFIPTASDPLSSLKRAVEICTI
ncbi:MAG: TIM barrel protein [Luteolibacter sp.]